MTHQSNSDSQSSQQPNMPSTPPPKDPSTASPPPHTRPETPPLPEDQYYTLEDHPPSPSHPWTLHSLLIASPEGATYATLPTPAARLAYMRQHSHAQQKMVEADSFSFKDANAGKMYYIRIRSPEGEAVRELMGDSDEEVEEGGEREGVLREFFRDNAHEVEGMGRRGRL